MLSTEQLHFLEKFKAGTYTVEEHEAFIASMLSGNPADTKAVAGAWSEFLLDSGAPGRADAAEIARFRQALQEYANEEHSKVSVPEPGTRITHRVHFLKKSWFRYAAAVMLFLGVGVYFYSTRRTQPTDLSGTQSHKKGPLDIRPGGNKALLTLDDGSSIILDSAANGQLAKQGATQIIKQDQGSLVYSGGNIGGGNIAGGNTGGARYYNTIRTPKGGQYQVVLPDGSRVWLNAASSVRFPTVFNEGQRSIDITGEVYLEITKDPGKPFIVNTNGTRIQVLGTAFNLNAYKDEGKIKTTLVEGSIKVSNAGTAGTTGTAGNAGATGNAVLLKPGQQAEVAGGSIGAAGGIKINSANLERELAWKNGLFILEDKSLQQVMREISRWYDLEVVYEGKIPDVHFGGKMGRDVNLSSVLKLLKGARLNFQLDETGKRLIVHG